jgi:hypothetical protein
MKKHDRVIYCVVGSDNGLIDISRSFGATKRKANKEGYDRIFARNIMTGNYWIASTKTNGIWSKYAEKK